jgi:hypothetical protein
MVALLLARLLAVAQTQTPKPLPRPAQPAPAPTATPLPPSAPAIPVEPAPTEAKLGVPIYPGAQFIASYPAGRSQRYYLFGTAATFVDVVTYYRQLLRQKGDLIFDVPATHEFDVGKFREETMSFPPGVTVKDFQSSVSEGYPNPKPGGQPARFHTIVQIVPVTER